MNIYRIARYFAWGVLLAPLALVLLWLLITFLPGVAKYIGVNLWAYLGQLSVFSRASELLGSFADATQFSFGDYLALFPLLLVGALGDSLIIACCIFLVKTVFTTFNRQYRARFTKPVWLLNLIGVVIGVAICQVSDLLGASGKSIVLLVSCLGCYIAGIVILLQSTGFTPGGTYHQRWSGFVIDLLLGIVGDLLDAACGVIIVTLLLRGAYFLQSGGSPVVYILLLVASALIPFLKETVMDALKPNPA